MTQTFNPRSEKLFALNLNIFDREAQASQAFLNTPDGKSLQEGLEIPVQDMWARHPHNRYVVLYSITGNDSGAAVHFGAARDLTSISATAFKLADWVSEHGARAQMNVHLDGEDGKRLLHEFTLRAESTPAAIHHRQLH